MTRMTPVRIVLPAAALALGLSACSGSSSTTATSTAGPLTITNGWCTSTDEAASTSHTMGTDTSKTEEPMSACFGTVTNNTDADINITGGSSPAAGKVEMHETVMGDNGKMQMQPVKGGFTIKSKSTFELKSGGNHVMLLDLPKTIKAGDDVQLTLTTKDGKSVKFTLPAKNFSGGKETYKPEGSKSDHSGMNHS